jgi:hypothetical protein
VIVGELAQAPDDAARQVGRHRVLQRGRGPVQPGGDQTQELLRRRRGAFEHGPHRRDRQGEHGGGPDGLRADERRIAQERRLAEQVASAQEPDHDLAPRGRHRREPNGAGGHQEQARHAVALTDDDLAVREPAGHAALRSVERNPHAATLAPPADTVSSRRVFDSPRRSG